MHTVLNSYYKSGSRCLSANRLRIRIPGRNLILEIGVVGQVAADRRMVAKLLVLHGWLAGSNRVEEVCLVGRRVAVSLRHRKSFRFGRLVVERPGLRMFRGPLRQILLAQPCRPAHHRISLRLWTYVLRSE